MPTRLLLDGPDIESLLARVSEEHGDAARIVHAERVRSGGIGGFFAKERYEVSVEVADAALEDASATGETGGTGDGSLPPALQLAEAMDAPAAVSTSGAAFADVLGSITASLGSSPEEPAPADRADRADRADGAERADTFVPSPRPPVVTGAGLVRATPRPLTTYDRTRPPRPPRGAGAVLALVGEARTGYDIAGDLARTMRIDPASVLVAAPEPVVKLPASRRIADPVTARVRAGRLLTAASASIVVVDLPIGADPDWSAAVVDALGATAVWAVVDATRKVADLNRWTKGLSRIDALVVHNAAASDDPGSVRALGIPVALLDGRTATAAAWASVEDGDD